MPSSFALSMHLRWPAGFPKGKKSAGQPREFCMGQKQSWQDFSMQNTKHDSLAWKSSHYVEVMLENDEKLKENVVKIFWCSMTIMGLAH